MNHEILQQQRASKNSQKGYVACQKLIGVRFDNGKVHEDKNETIVKFDLYIKAPESAGHDEEKYFVVINFRSQVDTALTLVGVDRLTPYSPYELMYQYSMLNKVVPNNTDTSDIKKQLETLDTAKATDPGKVPVIVLKICAPELAVSVAKLF
eukprot:g41039.t1